MKKLFSLFALILVTTALPSFAGALKRIEVHAASISLNRLATDSGGFIVSLGHGAYQLKAPVEIVNTVGDIDFGSSILYTEGYELKIEAANKIISREEAGVRGGIASFHDKTAPQPPALRNFKPAIGVNGQNGPNGVSGKSAASITLKATSIEGAIAIINDGQNGSNGQAGTDGGDGAKSANGDDFAEGKAGGTLGTLARQSGVVKGKFGARAATDGWRGQCPAMPGHGGAGGNAGNGGAVVLNAETMPVDLILSHKAGQPGLASQQHGQMGVGGAGGRGGKLDGYRADVDGPRGNDGEQGLALDDPRLETSGYLSKALYVEYKAIISNKYSQDGKAAVGGSCRFINGDDSKDPRTAPVEAHVSIIP